MQIHFVPERQHWVVSSYHQGEVKLYDSLFNGKLTPSLEIQIAQLYRPANLDSKIMVTAERVQQQKGTTDCGLFSIAYAYHAAKGEKVSGLTLDQENLRNHLSTCFENGEITAFPSSSSNTTFIKSSKKHLFVTVYCICAMPDSYDKKMISCEQCENWYHFKCMNIKTAPDVWYCANCKI